MGENDVLKVHIINGEFDFTEFFDECDKLEKKMTEVNNGEGTNC